MGSSNVFSTIENPLDEVFWEIIWTSLTELHQELHGFNSIPSFSLSSLPNLAPLLILAVPIAHESASNSSVHWRTCFRINTPTKSTFTLTILILDLLPNVSVTTRASLKLTLQHTNVSFTVEDHLSFYLSVYWLIFHPQFSILHKPSFGYKNCEPPLLGPWLSWMQLLSLRGSGVGQQETPERLLSDSVIPPIRYVIFWARRFQWTPIRLWILQSLNS